MEGADEARPGFLVVAPGLWTTVQDLGRPGYQQYGVPPSGALDAYALEAANRLVGNPPQAAGLEVTLRGPVLRVEFDGLVACTGADLGFTIDGRPAMMWQAHRVRPGQVLAFSGRKAGCRAYLAASGGIAVPCVMGSRSTYVRAKLGGLNGRALANGDRVSVGSPSPGWRERAGLALPYQLRRFGLPQPVRAILGPQDWMFTSLAIRRLFGAAYRVSPRSDRMGYRLEGPRLAHRDGADIVSEGIAPGSIQVPADGRPIVLLADRQTTGGYAKIATVISADLDFLAQAAPGDRVTFRKIDVPGAHRVRRERQELLEEVARFTGTAGLPSA
ncbi:MAG: biotin-dependent carboxyltransferase family protein [Firmicutes bacterium]|nr:biotin-dependent carboxyltransferase family protein [Bacillota bacterium]